MKLLSYSKTKTDQIVLTGGFYWNQSHEFPYVRKPEKVKIKFQYFYLLNCLDKFVENVVHSSMLSSTKANIIDWN